MSGLAGVSLKTDCANPDFVLSARWETTVRSGQPVVSSGQQTMLSSRETQPECVPLPHSCFMWCVKGHDSDINVDRAPRLKLGRSRSKLYPLYPSSAYKMKVVP